LEKKGTQEEVHLHPRAAHSVSKSDGQMKGKLRNDSDTREGMYSGTYCQDLVTLLIPNQGREPKHVTKLQENTSTHIIMILPSMKLTNLQSDFQGMWPALPSHLSQTILY
jgi:hypothetical protein